MTSLLAADAPLTPDGDQAQSWVREELSRPEYGDRLSPLTRAIRWLLELVGGAFGQGGHQVPVGAIVLAVFAVFLVVLAVIVVRNPVRLTHRAASSAVFDGEPLTREDADARAREATAARRWDEAVVWTFRVLVADLADRGEVRDAPGLTAREATSQARRHHEDLAGELDWSSTRFDDVRYGTPGTSGADEGDVARLRGLVRALASAPAAHRHDPPGPPSATPGPTPTAPGARATGVGR